MTRRPGSRWTSGPGPPAARSRRRRCRANSTRQRIDKQATAQVLVAEGSACWAAIRRGQAVAVFEAAWDVVRRSGVINAWDAPVFPWLRHGPAAASGKRCPQYRPQLRGALLKQAEASGPPGPAGDPQVPERSAAHAARTRLAGRPAWRRRAGPGGSSTTACRWHSSRGACTSPPRRGSNAGWSVSRSVGRAPTTTCSAERSETAELEADFKPEDSSDADRRPATLSLVDRFDTVLEAGREIASGLSREAIFRKVQERGRARCSAGKPARSCRCRSPRRRRRRGGVPGSGVSGNAPRGRPALGVLVDRAVQPARRVICTEAVEAEAERRARRAGGPLGDLHADLRAQQPAACFAVTHRQMSRLFGDDDSGWPISLRPLRAPRWRMPPGSPPCSG